MSEGSIGAFFFLNFTWHSEIVLKLFNSCIFKMMMKDKAKHGCPDSLFLAQLLLANKSVFNKLLWFQKQVLECPTLLSFKVDSYKKAFHFEGKTATADAANEG